MKIGDALHISFAEKAGCDVLLTTDDKFISDARRVLPPLSIHVQNPVEWLQENPL